MTLATIVILALIALMAPIGTAAIVLRRATLKWTEMLLIGGTLVVPLVAIFSILGFITPFATVVVLGIIVGHLLTHLDND